MGQRATAAHVPDSPLCAHRPALSLSPCRAGRGSPVFQFGAIYRMNTDGSGVELVASGGWVGGWVQPAAGLCGVWYVRPDGLPDRCKPSGVSKCKPISYRTGGWCACSAKHGGIGCQAAPNAAMFG